MPPFFFFDSGRNRPVYKKNGAFGCIREIFRDLLPSYSLFIMRTKAHGMISATKGSSSPVKAGGAYRQDDQMMIRMRRNLCTGF